jgi:hypothetical protein
VSRLLRGICAVLLIVEGLSSALRTAMRLQVIIVYPWVTVLFTAMRLVVAVQQFTAGWLALGNRPPSSVIARWAYLQSATLLTFELGFRFSPTNVFPAYRWWFVGAYWIYVLIGIAIFRPKYQRGD